MNDVKKYYWSLDISTTNIGSALWDENGKLVELKHLELKTDKNIPVDYRDLHKASIFKNYIQEYKEKIRIKYGGVIDTVIVEEPLGGSNNANTVSLLFGFNGMCRLLLFQVFETYPIKISVYESRKKFCSELVKTSYKKGEKVEVLSFPPEYRTKKKEYVWEKVSKLEPQIEWVYKKSGEPKDMCFDMSDSYAVGYAFLMDNNIL